MTKCGLRVTKKWKDATSQHFDVIASNIPFGDVSVFDPLLSNHEIPAVKQSTQAIHNYFFVKSVMSAREGGDDCLYYFTRRS
jgi:hypothetical protein